MFEWLKAKKSERFGSEMASLVLELMPPGAMLNDSKRASKANFVKQKMQKKIEQFKQGEVLNFYKTAKLLNAFKWDLKDAGYDPDLADSFASWIMITLRS